jgi:2-C-methyl-D-erythritol 4-phosphate cytidylyltransferase
VLGQGEAACVVLAGGSGSRVGADLNKVYLPLAGRRVISWSFHWAAQVSEIGHFILVVRPEDAELATRILDRDAPGLQVELVTGGDTRHASEQAALDRLADRIGSGAVRVVAIHDGARPLAGPALFRSTVTTAAAVGGAVPAVPAVGVLPVDADGRPIVRAADGAGRPRLLARVQTPQAFRAAGLVAGYAAAARAGYQGTDTASSLERFGDLTVQVVAGSPDNLKVTYPDDLRLAERLLTAHQHRLP